MNSPSVSLIVAMGNDRVIGCDNRLPWSLPADMRRFRQLTLDKPIIMGRKTYESIGKPLDRRTNIVMTQQPGFAADGCVVVHDADGALAACPAQASEIMIIGGSSIYAMFLPRADRVYLTEVEGTFEGDTYFPELDADWIESERKPNPSDRKNPYPYTFVTFERKR